MSLLQNTMAKSGTANFYNGVATQSLRMDYGSDPNLNITNSGSPTLNTKGTLSFWYKRGIQGSGTGQHQYLIHTGTGTADNTHMDLKIETGDALSIGAYGTTPFSNSRLLRDASAWYHIVVAFDSTSGTASERLIKVYVNGVAQTGTFGAVAQNQQFPWINASQAIYIGRHASVNRPMDGYLAEWNLIDGQALAPTSFGETKNGVWIPIKYTGTYGDNGARLKFDQVGVGTASTSTIGADTSGNNNHWTSSGIVASDCAMPDSPENNFATLNPLSKQSASALSEGNLKAVITSGTNSGRTPSTFAVSSGKWYWEVRQSSANRFGMGVFDTDKYVMTNEDAGADAHEWAWITDGGDSSTGILFNNSSSSNHGVEVANGEVIMVALDADNDAIWFGKENSWFNTDGSSNSATVKTQIEAGTTTNAGHTSVTGTLTPVFVRQTSNDTLIVNFGQDSSFVGNETAAGNTDSNGIGDFAYAPPSGFLALCTANLLEATISPNADTQADDHFNTVLYTGNATSGRSISGVGFGPDFVWAKIRVNTYPHFLANSSVGATKYLSTNSADAEATDSGNFTSLDSDGFTIGANGGINANGSTFVAWNWLANGGTTSSNTEGSITSTVQANTTAGFSIVTYTGNATNNATVGHGLLSAPSFIITKKRGATGSWQVLTNAPSDYEEGDFLGLDETNAVGNSANVSFAPTSTTWKMQGGQVGNTATTIVAYCFHSVEGYSKIGSYTGNANADGTFVYLGFRPAWIMAKSTDAQAWQIYDTKRNVSNPSSKILFPSETNAEQDDASAAVIDMLSNGFKQRVNDGGGNGAGTIYIYMAFAEAPFKYANAR